MSDALIHRGPDAQGLWQDPDVTVLLGHRRLSIIDLSPDGAQPMSSPSGRYVIAYNGEIYNFQDIRQALASTNTVFRGHSDTEVFLAAIDAWGFDAALEKINGMFAFALWDRKTRTLHLVRDRLGKKPLYVGWANHALVFSSELKSLKAHPKFHTEINRQTVSTFMTYGYIPAPHCIYKDVWQIPPGHCLSLSLDKIYTDPRADLFPFMAPYWCAQTTLNEARSNPVSHPNAIIIDEFEDLLNTCVKDRMISDVPLGSFLSGGIDSSVITALMQKNTNKPIKTFSIGFHETGFDEASYAKKVAQHLGTDHHELYVHSIDARNVIPSLPDMYDEPFSDISAIPTYLVSQFARDHITVALSGDGGDEMLGGYNRHIQGPKAWKHMNMMPRFSRNMIARFLQRIPVKNWNQMVPQKPQFGTHMHKLAHVLSVSSQNDLYEGFLRQWNDPPMQDHVTAETKIKIKIKNKQSLSFAERMMFADTVFYLPHNVLTKVDRASMAASLEVRSPLLDPRIYSYVWRLPHTLKIRKNKGKWLLRKVLERHVPNDLFERPKQGFSIPVGQWLRTDLKDWAEDLLNETTLKQDGFLNPKLIRQTWIEHMNGYGNHATKLWTVLMFQAWLKRWG